MLVVYDRWRKTFREGFAPFLSDGAVEALAVACETNDPRLVQETTTVPPPLMCVQTWPAEAGCLGGFAGVIDNGGFGVATVGQAEAKFAELCYQCDQVLGEPASFRHFLNWYDDTPRFEMLRELGAELRAEQAARLTRTKAA